MIDIDIENERMVKEYIEGNTIFDMVKKDISVEATSKNSFLSIQLSF